MIVDPKEFRESLRHASLTDIIYERDRIISQMRKYERGKTPEEDFCRIPSPETEYYCNLSYLSEICDLIQERIQGEDIKKLFKEIN